MAGHLLLLVLMYSFSEIRAQAPPPKLTVNPPVITETDSVTLNCQTPFDSVSQCFFHIVKEQTVRVFSCLKTLPGTELLLMTHQSSPAEVKVRCYYSVNLGEFSYTSPHSDISSITINIPPPPKLTVNPPVIAETDSVTLNCQTPSSVSGSQCYFHFMRRKPSKTLSCLKTLTGTELLNITHQSSPAEVKVTCFYLVANHSPESNVSSISIQTPPPKLTVNPPVITETDSVTLNCQTPSSVSVSQCYIYTVKEQTAKVFPCVKTLTGTELLNMARQSSPAVVELTCYYTAEHRGGQYQSLHSNTSSITIQPLPPPKLTVNPQVITETDSVTLNCQTPFDSVSQCFFHIVKEQTVRVFSCLKTLPGTELLLMTHQSSPAVVNMTCYYSVNLGEFSYTSPHSDISSITINIPPPPKLTVNPPVIAETDSVTLNCQTPSSVSVSQCYFYTLSGGTKVFSCLKTLTGTELLNMANQSSPAVVKVKCSYAVKLGEKTPQSPYSDISSITINTVLPPKLTVTPPVITETDSVTLNCQTPSSVSVSQCYFYTLSEKAFRDFPCVKTLTGTELLLMAHQSSPADVEITCYYTVKLGEKTSQSPPSNISSITINNIVETVSTTVQSMSTLTMTETVTRETNTAGIVTLTSANNTVKTASDSNVTVRWMWKVLVAVTGLGVTLGVTSLGLVLLCTKRRSGKCFNKRSQASVSGDIMMTNTDYGRLLPPGNGEGYSMVSSVRDADGPSGSEKLNNWDPQNQDSDTYHMYSTISEEPAPSALKDAGYSSLQAH
ncbi:basement membrane-specific heparan sulfate proteoglycan core protein isoform X1 [Lates calcarifer]|uniref:Basement membrane-specific heparan sulfate proteoglycan core protein isoform X1 n=1 Tax=Lates calcarifer TaxID=8187 RepID=A0AAJ8DTH7_LATCA|nr:basement membrane-specific heparan sulfate proteoglycan core protein isoform X1 [Lates calcarifer]